MSKARPSQVPPKKIFRYWVWVTDYHHNLIFESKVAAVCGNGSLRYAPRFILFGFIQEFHISSDCLAISTTKVVMAVSCNNMTLRCARRSSPFGLIQANPISLAVAMFGLD
eukprot:scaffold2223_cov46-Cyclotella_meneghiniana.AAC.5